MRIRRTLIEGVALAGIAATLFGPAAVKHYNQHRFWPLTEHPYGYAGGRPTQTLDRLVVNTKNDVRNSASLPEYEGMKQLRELVRISDMEESWLYAHPNKWVEIGEGEFFDGRIRYVKVDEKYVQSMFTQHDTLRKYHIHPIDPDVKGVEKYEKERKITRAQSEKLKGVSFAFYAMPSIIGPIGPQGEAGGDIITMVSLSTQFHKIKPNGNLSSRIISELGVTHYTLTKEGLRHFKNKDIDYIRNYAEGLDKKFKDKHSFKSEVYRAMRLPLDEWRRSQIDRIREMAGNLSDKYIVITFFPFERPAYPAPN